MTPHPNVRLVPLLLLCGCAANDAPAFDVTVVTIEEVFLTEADRRDNLDSPAVWLGQAGEAWVVTTGKSSHRLHVHDAASGAPVAEVGARGAGPGEFRRPNGLAIAGDLLFVVERDNARVQVLRLPRFEFVTTFGEPTLRRPYGIAVLQHGPDTLEVFVTDAYRGFLGRSPPDRKLGERVKRYRLAASDSGVAVIDRHAFGDTAGEGRLREVESLAVDPDAGLVLVADEAARDVKVFRVDGSFTGRVLWGDVIRHEPEGIVLFACGPEDGYWILADQDRVENRFLVFHRRGFGLVGAFTGTAVRNTDGLALVQRPVGSMAAGALFAVHDDRAVGAFSWSEVAAALGLRDDCLAQNETPLFR